MKNYKDTVTGKHWSFDDDVVTSSVDDGLIFFSAAGEQLVNVPLTLEPVDAIPVLPPTVLVPASVSRFQGREAMWRTPHGETTLFEAAEAIINSTETPAVYRRAWVDLQEFRRDSVMLQAIAENLGLSGADLDALFILAAGIKA